MSLNILTIEEQKQIQNVTFPLTLSPPKSNITFEETLDFIESNRTELLDKLLQHGVILFRGFPVQSPKDFNDFAVKFGWENLPYIGMYSHHTFHV
jgi:hypothetical protein